MPGALEGRGAAVTGASSGIGEATALALAREGAAVALAARRRERLEEVARHVEAEGGRALAVQCDIAEESEARAFIERAHRELGGLYALVNNAGLMLQGPVEGADTEEWRRMLAVNVLGLLYCTHAALPLMREGGGGHIVNLSSTAGRTATAGSAVYNLTKFGITGFSEALRQEALHANIRVTCIEPGFVATELQGHNRDPVIRRAIEREREETPRVLEAKDIAATIVYVLRQPEHVALNEVMVRPTGQRR